MFKKFFKLIQQKGQALTFFAMSVPFLFLCTAMAADIGWLYFNQSRLQNAADAAAVAAAQQLIFDEQNLSDYTYTKLVANTDEGLARLVRENTISKRDTSDGDKMAEQYIKFNLDNGGTDFKVVDVSPPRGSDGELSYTPKWNTVKFKHMLYGSDEKDYKTLYYVVTLSEQLEHIFADIVNKFDFIPHLEARAFAVVKISHYRVDNNSDPLHGPSLYQQMKELREKENYANWWEIKGEYDALPSTMRQEQYGTTDTTTIARMRSVQAMGNEYIVGNAYRTETLTLHGASKAVKVDGNKVKSYGNTLNQDKLDSLFVDLKADRSDKNLKDNDWGSNEAAGYNTYDNHTKITTGQTFSNGLTGKDVYKFRIHDLINIGRWTGSKYEYPYKVRDGKEPPDPLYVYIESEDNYVDGTAANSVRQMIINVNADNTNEKYRPMFIFYDGPQKYRDSKGKEGKNQGTWYEEWRETWKHLGYEDDIYVNHARNSLPVIFNINANFRGVLFAPNSAVVINGNEHTFEGFVVAEKFLRLRNAYDFPPTAAGGDPGKIKKEDRQFTKDGKENYNEYYLDENGLEYYHTMAEGGTRYVQYTHKKSPSLGIVRYYENNVIYAIGEFKEVSLSELDTHDEITVDDNIYWTETPDGYKYFKIDGNYIKVNDADNYYIKLKPNTFKYRASNKNYVIIDTDNYEKYDENFNPIKDSNGDIQTEYLAKRTIQIKSTQNVKDRFVLYTYSRVEKEKANIIDDFSSREKEYVDISPMYVDEFGNVLYMPLDSENSISSYRPNPLDTEWHSGDSYEVIYKPSTFHLSKATYNSYNKVILIDYTQLNDSNRNVNDVFYTTVRSDWID